MKASKIRWSGQSSTTKARSRASAAAAATGRKRRSRGASEDSAIFLERACLPWELNPTSKGASQSHAPSAERRESASLVTHISYVLMSTKGQRSLKEFRTLLSTDSGQVPEAYSLLAFLMMQWLWSKDCPIQLLQWVSDLTDSVSRLRAEGSTYCPDVFAGDEFSTLVITTPADQERGAPEPYGGDSRDVPQK